MSRDSASVPTLYVCESTTYRPATAVEVLAAAHRTISLRFRRGRILSSPTLVREYLQIAFAPLEHEVFCLVLLDCRRQLLACLELFRGTIDVASVHPREVVKEVLKHNAAAVILAHNHPSGCVTPSPADEQITQRLREALQLIDVPVLDHLVVAGNSIASMAERGLL